LLGAGKVSELAARNLLSRGARIAVVANRTADRAGTLAKRLGAEALSLERVGEPLGSADVVVSSTSAPGFVLRRDDVAAALRGRRREGRGTARAADRGRAADGRIRHRADREQAVTPADGTHEAGGRGSRWGPLC